MAHWTELITPTESAEIIGATVRRTYDAFRRDSFPHERDGRKFLAPRNVVHSYAKHDARRKRPQPWQSRFAEIAANMISDHAQRSREDAALREAPPEIARGLAEMETVISIYRYLPAGLLAAQGEWEAVPVLVHIARQLPDLWILGLLDIEPAKVRAARQLTWLANRTGVAGYWPLDQGDLLPRLAPMLIEDSWLGQPLVGGVRARGEFWGRYSLRRDATTIRGQAVQARTPVEVWERFLAVRAEFDALPGIHAQEYLCVWPGVWGEFTWGPVLAAAIKSPARKPDRGAFEEAAMEHMDAAQVSGAKGYDIDAAAALVVEAGACITDRCMRLAMAAAQKSPPRPLAEVEEVGADAWTVEHQENVERALDPVRRAKQSKKTGKRTQPKTNARKRRKPKG